MLGESIDIAIGIAIEIGEYGRSIDFDSDSDVDVDP